MILSGEAWKKVKSAFHSGEPRGHGCVALPRGGDYDKLKTVSKLNMLRDL